MKDKVLTISIAAYNVEKYIKDTLDSLVVPDIFDDLEVLIINDGSTDSTPMIAEQYTKKYPNTFKLINKKNGGYGSTINTALRIACGKYFKQLDGDDWFETKNLNAFIEFLKRINADCIYSPYWVIHQKNGEMKLQEIVNLSKNVIDVEDISMYAFTFKTNILKKNHIKITEGCFYRDTEYALKPLFFVNTIDYFNHAIYCYRLGRVGQSVSRDGWIKHYEDYNSLALEMMFYYKQNELFISSESKEAIEKYISAIHKANLCVALEVEDKAIREKYKQLDLAVKSQFPEFYKKRNLKMTILANSGYRLWGIIRIYHKLFEKTMIN